MKTIKEVAKFLEDLKLAETISSLNKRIEALEQVEEAPRVEKGPGAEPASEWPQSQIPVPPAYRDAVDEKLNKRFGILINQDADSPKFTLTIIVPDKYSSATEEQKKSIGGYDYRPKSLTYAEGVNGVNEWAEKVYNSFSNEMKAAIVADRNA